MISTLTGKITEKHGQMVVLEVGGVGYGLFVTFEDFGALKTDEQMKVYVHESIRENAYELFGFRNQESKNLFEQLLTVKGVGPKMALAILSVAGLEQVRQSIAAGDIKFISQAAGVGRKVAERVVVDLKDKVGLAPSDAATEFLTTPAADPSDEALQGLVALGFSVQDAAEALKKVDKKLPPSERIKEALKS